MRSDVRQPVGGTTGVSVHADDTFEQWWNISASQGANNMVTDANGQASTFTTELRSPASK